MKSAKNGIDNSESVVIISALFLMLFFMFSMGCTKMKFGSNAPDNIIDTEIPLAQSPTPPPQPPPPPPTDPSPTPPVFNKIIETFIQEDQPAKVDILIIDDNSRSMADEQVKLGEKFAKFIDSLTNIDWQIGITTTDVSNGMWGLQGDLLPIFGSNYILTSSIPDYETHFMETIVRNETLICKQLAECPSPDEQPLAATVLAIKKRATTNNGFFREGADFALIVLSDENECSEGDPSCTQPSDVVHEFNKAFGNTKNMTAYGIIIEPGDVACLNERMTASEVYGDFYGTYVDELANLTGGVTSSICDNDFSTGLKKIGSQIRKSVKTVTLKKSPKANSLTVAFTPQAPDAQWTLIKNQINFSQPPPKGTKIIVTYEEE